MGQIVVIDASPKNKKILTELLFPQKIIFINNQENLDSIGEEIEAIIIDSPQEAFSYLEEIRKRNIFLPLIFVVYSQYDQVKVIEAAEIYQCLNVWVEELSTIAKLLEQLRRKKINAERYLKPYLIGKAIGINKAYKNLQAVVRLNVDVFLYSETGCGKRSIAYWLHQYSLGPGEFMELNLNNYYGDDYEVRVWAALKEIYALQAGSQTGRPLYQTLYIKGLEHKDILFVVSLLEWVYQKRKSNILPLRVVVSLEDKAMLKTLSHDFLEKYFLLELPALREHREDIAEIVRYYLENFNNRYRRSVSFIDTELLEYFSWYEWPGNIEELRYNLEAVFLASPVEKKEISLRDILINEKQLFDFCIQSTGGNNYPEALKKLKKIGI